MNAGKNHAGRTIPTRVGNIGCVMPGLMQPPDHPHACGEYCVPLMFQHRRDGPSPRVWGILPKYEPHDWLDRTNPTRVGNMRRRRSWPSRRTDHPHACGEYSSSLATRAPVYGPSPRVWGILIANPAPGVTARTIPTRVGNIPLQLSPLKKEPDHPHACGEYHTPIQDDVTIHGPSPRVWGIYCIDNNLHRKIAPEKGFRRAGFRH